MVGKALRGNSLLASLQSLLDNYPNGNWFHSKCE